MAVVPCEPQSSWQGPLALGVGERPSERLSRGSHWGTTEDASRPYTTQQTSRHGEWLQHDDRLYREPPPPDLDTLTEYDEQEQAFDVEPIHFARLPYAIPPPMSSYSGSWRSRSPYAHQPPNDYPPPSALHEPILPSPASCVYSPPEDDAMRRRPGFPRRQTTHLTTAPAELHTHILSPQPRWTTSNRPVLFEEAITLYPPSTGLSVPPQSLVPVPELPAPSPPVYVSAPAPRSFVPPPYHSRSHSWDATKHHHYSVQAHWQLEHPVQSAAPPEPRPPPTQDEGSYATSWPPPHTTGLDPVIPPSSHQSWTRPLAQRSLNSTGLTEPSATEFGSSELFLPDLPPLPSQLPIPYRRKVRTDAGYPGRKSKKRQPESSDGDRRHICGLCRVAFTRPSALRTHQLTHTRARDHVCPTCNRGFTVLSNLTRHLKLYEQKAAQAFALDGEAGLRRTEAAHQRLWEKVEAEQKRLEGLPQADNDEGGIWRRSVDDEDCQGGEEEY